MFYKTSLKKDLNSFTKFVFLSFFHDVYFELFIPVVYTHKKGYEYTRPFQNQSKIK